MVVCIIEPIFRSSSVADQVLERKKEDSHVKKGSPGLPFFKGQYLFQTTGERRKSEKWFQTNLEIGVLKTKKKFV